MDRVPVDTNILVRLATGDSRSEHAAAAEFVAANAVLILPTVLLETEWVLRSLYGYSPIQFLGFTEWLMGSETVEVDGLEMVNTALELHAAGFDFADAMHLAGAQGKPFATFDKALIRRARRRKLTIRALRTK